jgi:nitric oxide reductase NorE protein
MTVFDALGTHRDETTASVNRGGHRHIPGEPGIWVLLFGDMVVFAVLFGVYLQRRGQDKELFAQSQDNLNRTFGAINTLVLLCSSMLVVLAVSALRSERYRHLASGLTLAAVGVGACFVVIKGIEYHKMIASDMTPSVNEFYMYYFILTGLHLAHVIVGLGVLIALSALARRPAPTPTRIAFFEGGGCFWHMVDLLWIVIFPLLFLVR